MMPHERCGVSNHQQLDFLFDNLFMLISKKTSGHATRVEILGLPVDSPQGPVTRKAFPWYNVIMHWSVIPDTIPMTSWWQRWRLKSPDSRLFTQPFIQTQIKENIKAPRHWPLCGEFTGPVNSPHKRPVTRKMFPFDDVIMHQEIAVSIMGMSVNCEMW